MSAVTIPNLFDFANAWLREWSRRQDAFYEQWVALLRRVSGRSEAALSPQDIALDRINRMQVLLYRGYVRRQRLKTLRSRQREMQRFAQWLHRHSANFRHLIDLYPEWLAEFDDPSCPRARLMRTIAFHLYQ